MGLCFAGALLCTTLVNTAVACVCLPIPKTPCEAAENAVVFRGRLVEAIPIYAPATPGLPPPPPNGMRYRFHVYEDFSGADRTSVELVRTGMTSCDRTYSVGVEYVIYAGLDTSGRLTPGSKCDRTRPVENADADLEYLRRRKVSRTVLAGTLRTPTSVVTGERVTATSSSASFETETNKDGLFQFLGLPPGKYTLHIAHHPELQGLNAEVKEGACSVANSRPE
jgi:hypothetical protein